MTAVSLASTGTPVARPLRRITRIVRLHIANPATTLVQPWIILGLILIANWAVWYLITANLTGDDLADTREGLQWSGASAFVFVYMMTVAIQAINATFPLALGFGTTRREFWLGSSLTFVGLSAVYAVGLTLLSVVEQATNGWGLGGRMFTAVYYGTRDVWWERGLVFFFGLLFFFFIGAAMASVYVRWRARGMTVFFVVLAFVLIALAAVVTFTDSWPAVGRMFVEAGPLGVAAALLVPAAISGIAGYFLLRGATPRS